MTASLEQNHPEKIQADTTQNLNCLNISQSTSLGSLSYKSFRHKSASIAYHADAITDTDEETPAEPDHITQSFTDFLTCEDEMKNITFTLTEGSVLNVSLSCPSNPNLDYNLVLASVANDGSVTAVKASNLGTYVDPQTGKTVDEGISYVHNQGTAGKFALFILSSAGSSTTDSFTLTVSLSNPGTFDRNEPNDSAFDATQMSGLTSSGSLHVENDQDWYVTNLNSGVYEVTAGSYNTDIYYVTDGNKLAKSEQLGKRYILDSGTYYIKVSSDST